MTHIKSFINTECQIAEILQLLQPAFIFPFAFHSQPTVPLGLSNTQNENCLESSIFTLSWAKRPVNFIEDEVENEKK